MRERVPSFGRAPRPLLVALALLAAIGLTPAAALADSAPVRAGTSGNVLQTNLVSDLPGVAAVTDGNQVNARGI